MADRCAAPSTSQNLADIEGRTQGGPGLYLGPKKHYVFRVSYVNLRNLHLSSMCSKAFCYLGRPRKPAAW